MAFNSTIAVIVGITDMLTTITLLTVWLVLRRSRPLSPALPMFGAVLGGVVVWGALWTWWPPLAALRLEPPPRGQPFAILSVIAAMIALLLLPSVRRFLRTANLNVLVAMAVWRVIYGAALLAIGLMGGLPAGFFWSAAFGDIAVGLWGITIMARRYQVSDREIVGWNVAGLLDLAHVLVLGTLYLRPFFLANPDLPPVNLLPLAGVPVFIGLHVLTLWGFAARHSSAKRMSPFASQS